VADRPELGVVDCLMFICSSGDDEDSDMDYIAPAGV
jgi:hypothetical protein